MNKSKLSIKQWLEEEISKAGKPIKFEKTRAYVHDNLIIAKFNETRMTIQTYNFTDYLSDEQSQEKQHDLKNMLPAGSSYSGIIAELFIEYNIRTNKFKVLCIVKSNKSETEGNYEICNFTEEEIATILNIDMNQKNRIEFNPELLLGEEVNVTLVEPIPFTAVKENINYSNNYERGNKNVRRKQKKY